MTGTGRNTGLSAAAVAFTLVTLAAQVAPAQCFGTAQGSDPRWDWSTLTYDPAPGASWQRFQLDVPTTGGATEPRFYWNFVPPSAPVSMRPLVIVLHGGGAGYLPGEHAVASEWGFNAVAAARGWIVSYPGALFDPADLTCNSGKVARHWNDGRFFSADQPTLYSIEQQVDDVGFLRELVAEQIVMHGADPDRIYVVGASNGAMMIHRLLGDPNTSGLFQAVALNIATLPAASADPAVPRFTPLAPVHALHLFGELDSVIPLEGGRIFAQPLTVDTVGGCNSSPPSDCSAGIVFDNAVGLGHGSARAVTIARFEQMNGVTSYAFDSFPDVDGDGLVMQRGRASNPGRVRDLELYEMQGGGHRNWGQSPSSALGDTCVFKFDCDGGRVNKTLLATSTFDVCWTELIADFFSDHP